MDVLQENVADFGAVAYLLIVCFALAQNSILSGNVEIVPIQVVFGMQQVEVGQRVCRESVGVFVRDFQCIFESKFQPPKRFDERMEGNDLGVVRSLGRYHAVELHFLFELADCVEPVP